MASPAYEKILHVQAVDLQLSQLVHQHANHPARQPVAESEAEIAGIDQELAAIEQRRHNVDRERKKLEDEAALLADRRIAIDTKLYGGEVTASKELLALQDEAAGLKTKQDAIEDQELELMEQLEQIDAERAEAGRRRATVSERLAGRQAELALALSGLDSEIETVEAERSRSAADSEPTLLARYEELRSQYGNVAVARLVNGACNGCHIHLSAMAVDQMTKMADDAVVTCEECGRLLVV